MEDVGNHPVLIKTVYIRVKAVKCHVMPQFNAPPAGEIRHYNDFPAAPV